MLKVTIRFAPAAAIAIAADTVGRGALAAAPCRRRSRLKQSEAIVLPPRARLVIVYDSELVTVSGGAEVRLTDVHQFP